MRPIYHRTDRRAQAHIYVAALAFLLHRAIEKKLKAARLDLSATEALNALKSVRVVDIDLGDGTTKRSVTRGTQRAAAVLRALKSVRVVDIDLGDGTTKRSVTAGTQRAAAVFRALGIANRKPPTPPTGSQTLM